MRRLPIVLLVLAVLMPATAHAANWGLGANLGLQAFQTEDVEDFSVISWPATDLLPGLRVNFAGENSPHEFHIDTQLILSSGGSESSRDFIAQFGYMFVFPSSTNLSTYLTGAAGAVFSGLDISDPVLGDINASTASATFGGGIGLRHRMGNGHGTVRAEVRYDRYTKGEDQGFILVPEGNAFALKLGFDLWDSEVSGP